MLVGAADGASGSCIDVIWSLCISDPLQKMCCCCDTHLNSGISVFQEKVKPIFGEFMFFILQIAAKAEVELLQRDYSSV